MDRNRRSKSNKPSLQNLTQNSIVHDYPEVKEYMSWRMKKNKKRLQRLYKAALVIQNIFRTVMAKKLLIKKRRFRACLLIQKSFRGWLGRMKFLDRARFIWASMLLQRAWRGYCARKKFFFFRIRIAAGATIQRVTRGMLARKFVSEVKRIRERAACVIQAMARRATARYQAWRMRIMRNFSREIQRVYRGHLGRRRANIERDKYIFSRCQTQGIEFGRQMLLEHKLHATKLQSEVILLSQEKMSSEEEV
jgi:hypothetical protein